MKSKIAIALGGLSLLLVSALFLGFSGDASFAQNALGTIEGFVAAELPLPTGLKWFIGALVCLVFLLKNRERV